MENNKELDGKPIEDHKEQMTIYVNGASIAVNVYDFQAIFRQQTPVEGKVCTTDLATVIMSPQHAKAFCKMLEKHIEKYEKKFGEIHIPEDIFKSEEIDLDKEEKTIVQREEVAADVRHNDK